MDYINEGLRQPLESDVLPEELNMNDAYHIVSTSNWPSNEKLNDYFMPVEGDIVKHAAEQFSRSNGFFSLIGTSKAKVEYTLIDLRSLVLQRKIDMLLSVDTIETFAKKTDHLVFNRNNFSAMLDVMLRQHVAARRSGDDIQTLWDLQSGMFEETIEGVKFNQSIFYYGHVTP